MFDTIFDIVFHIENQIVSTELAIQLIVAGVLATNLEYESEGSYLSTFCLDVTQDSCAPAVQPLSLNES